MSLVLLGACLVVTGCVLTPPQYEDSSDVIGKIQSDMQSAPRSSALSRLRLGLVLTNEQATVRNLREALFEFLKHTVREDLVIIFYSDHGMPDPGKASNLYLVAYDSDPEKIAATGFPMWDLDTALRRSGSSPSWTHATPQAPPRG